MKYTVTYMNGKLDMKHVKVNAKSETEARTLAFEKMRGQNFWPDEASITFMGIKQEAARGASAVMGSDGKQLKKGKF